MMSEMFDSIDPTQIPAGQDAAGYVDGNWRTFTALHGPHNLSVAVFASDEADALDDEPGDASNTQAPGWVRRELSLGHLRPCVYTSASNVTALLTALNGAGIARSQIRLWTAHYTYKSHLCDHTCGLPAGVTADATQWTDRSGGRNLDESTITDNFFNTTTPTEEPEMLYVIQRAGDGQLALSDGVSKVVLQVETTAQAFLAQGAKDVGKIADADYNAIPETGTGPAAAAGSATGKVSGTLTIS